MATRRQPVLPSLLLAAAMLLFLGLGVWQVERRAEKLALIDAVDRRLRLPPAPAPGPDSWLRVAAETDAYRPVLVQGTFLHDRESLVQASTGHGPGYWVMTPLRTDAGWLVLVNRGFVAAEDRERARRRAGEPVGRAAVTGLLRISEPGGGFLHANDPAADRWYSRDVAAIASARRLGAVAPYFIDAGPAPEASHQPVGGLTTVTFANNHLHYALTWFALAGLAGFGLVRVRRSRTADPDSDATREARR